MANTGYKRVITLRKYVNGVATDRVKANHKGDEDYVAPIYDTTKCPSTLTTTTAAPDATTTTTTTSAVEAVGKIASVAFCSGSSADCDTTLTNSTQNIIYVRLDDLKGTLVKSSSLAGSENKNKLVINNQRDNAKLHAEDTIKGYCYNFDEGILDEYSQFAAAETIDATTSAGEGTYLVSAVSILDAGIDDESGTRVYAPEYAPKMTLTFIPGDDRLEYSIEPCYKIAGDATVYNDFIGGGGLGDSNNVDDLV